MAILKSIYGSALVLAAAGMTAHGAVVYTEQFPNPSTTATASFQSVGWSAYMGSAATDISANATTAGGGVISSNVSSLDTLRGYAARTTNAAGLGLFVTTEPGSIAQSDMQSISFVSSDASIADVYRIVVQVGGNWYATSSTYASAAVGASSFTPSSSHSFTFDSSGTAWQALTVTPGTTLSLSSTALTGALPTGSITAFGLLTSGAAGDTPAGTMRFDNFSISAVPEPGMIGLAVLGAPLVLRRRRRA